jgi:hypothetical protein
MKDLLKVMFVLMLTIAGAEACEMTSSEDVCSAMTEPCEPIDLCAEACDPIAD